MTTNAAPVAVCDVAFDSRDVPADSVFVCVPGQEADGHEFASAAIEQGALALVVERELDVAVPQLIVSDARYAMGLAADAVYGAPTQDIDVVGVTGTNGKTTTSFLVYAILAAAGRRPGLLGTIERRVGGERRPAVRTTPEAAELHRAFAEMRDVGDRSCAMEVSSHASALHRLVGVRFRALAFTNLTQDHLDFHQSMEAYYEAKRAPFLERYEDERHPAAVVNVDDSYGTRLVAELRAAGAEPLSFAMTEEADLRPDAVVVEPGGTQLTLGELEITSALRGRFNAENLLAAAALGRVLGVSDDAIKQGLEHVRGVPGRFEAVPNDLNFTVIVDYAHTPDALATVLRSARAICPRSLICVFGCGGERDRSKRAPMGEVATELADHVVVTSDNPRGEQAEAIVDDILEGVLTPVDVEPDRRKAIEQALALAQEGDLVVGAGKGHESGQEIDGRVTAFDDREVAGEWLREHGTEAT